MLADENGHLHPNVEPVYSVLAAREPARVLRWLRKSPAVRILTDLGRDGRRVSHEELDRHLPGTAVEHLRKVLVAGAVLPDRDEILARLERKIDEAVTQVSDPRDRRLVLDFATSQPLRRLRRKAVRQRIRQDQATRARAEVAAAITLLSWLRARGVTLATCDQSGIDRWLADGIASRRRARAFVIWATEHCHCRALEIPLNFPEIKLARINDEQRWAMIDRLLHDDTVALADRVAGLLILLYAQPLDRIARLNRDQLVCDNGTTSLALAESPLQLTPPLDELVTQLAGDTDEQPWLFPGGVRGYPITAEGLAKRLRRLGIQPRTARNAALLDLASTVPAVVLSRLLGLHIRSATRWATRTAASNATYAAQLVRRAQHSSNG